MLRNSPLSFYNLAYNVSLEREGSASLAVRNSDLEAPCISEQLLPLRPLQHLLWKKQTNTKPQTTQLFIYLFIYLESMGQPDSSAHLGGSW